MAIVAGFGPLEVYIGAEEGVALTDVNDKYWSPIERNGIYPIECCKEAKDPWCKFLIEKVGHHRVRMTDLRGVYLSRVYRDSINFIEAAKNPPDICCEFEVFVKDGKVLFKADNGKYLSLIARGNLNIEAAKDGPDKYCEFTPTIGDIVSPKFEIISVDFKNVLPLTQKPNVVKTETYTNSSSVGQKHKFNMTWTKTESATTTWNHAWGLSSTVSSEFTFAKAEVTVSYSGSYGTSSTKQTSMTLGEETEVTIPPHKKVTANLIISKQEDCDIPFTAKIKKIKSNGEVKELTEQGMWRGVIYENVNVDIKEENL
ncbi:aerolysin-like protein isoform X8 [Brienomyrus brachyistius]|uniref:aerolysin-like protein isoform X8 n=1 Tax=Brienomyrus brachyistius TaxID=42636 RepID=UPI0020B3C9A0|nr:aerolysin-like protein isoform X8 [Brienomyrus brachyistius]XP_048844071.1 aerolysin-like protein isoform X9 [Brienomyrus brachyistius]XP_048844072.1 aerolysin-like protein isoform X8 [Brienomyrus brachyistius]XP_048844075.1 aerolysin-like protein isoform X8 [Brienomyrus brachyistius]